MPFAATVFRIMIASPSDVQRERGLVRDVVHEWNAANAAERGIVLMPVGWESDLAPEMGNHPQAIINKRILEDADLLVGVFWTRVGTPTPEYASGAVEEIEEHLAAGKQTMLYFSGAPVSMDALDRDQYDALCRFKDSCKSRGIYQTYADLTDFRQRFAYQLQIVLNGDAFDAMVRGAGARSPDGPSDAGGTPALSKEALLLLKGASQDPQGAVMRLSYGAGASIQTNEQTFNEDSSARTMAMWDGAIEELERAGLLRATGDAREVFELTRAGFQAADTIAS
jgi:hypothetical protein